ncbi:sugar transferase [Asticcacaulis sp.]|uniref:sugar transferase n=1 Tax=Asticcacaulis sp. TaxID=1872648 RepID=UPI00261E4E9A|nr:sugar transferase [Asticcacaulis sp.]
MSEYVGWTRYADVADTPAALAPPLLRRPPDPEALILHRKHHRCRVAHSPYKRLMDVGIAALALLFLLPALLLICLLIKLDSAGPVLFCQRRTGLKGRVFKIYKFRTMRVAEDGAQVVQAQRNDARVTSLGRILRRTSLDELPQLFNVLKGDMSLVGPRPHAIAHDKAFASRVPGYTARFRARPGLTGLAAIRGYRGEIRTPACIENRIKADNEYIQSWSIRDDLVILMRTALIISRDKNAY